MRSVAIKDLVPGMKIGKDVYNNNRLYLLKGFVLKDSYIDKLKTLDMEEVWIEDDAPKAPDVDTKELYNKSFNNIKSVLDCVKNGSNVDESAVKDAVTDIADHLLSNDFVFAHLNSIREIDNYTYTHSINVCIYAVMIGKAMGFSVAEQTELGVCAILHDIGKCRVPPEVLLKPGRLTLEEFQIAKKHTSFGKEIIDNSSNLPPRTAIVAMQHHERMNGSGYPFGLKGDEIDIFAAIIAVSDVYDAMTSDKVYSKKLLPQNAVQFLLGNSGLLFHPDVVNVFIKNIPLYPIGTNVVLNSGHVGVVVEINKNMLVRPKVKVCTDEHQTPLTETYIVDLRRELKFNIVEVVNKAQYS